MPSGYFLQSSWTLIDAGSNARPNLYYHIDYSGSRDSSDPNYMNYTFTVYNYLQWSDSNLGTGYSIGFDLWLGSVHTYIEMKSTSESWSGQATHTGTGSIRVYVGDATTVDGGGGYYRPQEGVNGLSLGSDYVRTDPKPYTACGAPGWISASQPYQNKGSSVTISWGAGSAGTNNPINHYYVEYYDTSWQPYTTTTGTSCTGTLPDSRGVTRYWRVQTIGSVDGYNSGFTGNASCTTYVSPQAPGVSASRTKLPSSGGTVTFTLTYYRNANQSPATTFYYQLNSGSRVSTGVTTSGGSFNLSISGTSTVYFWSCDNNGDGEFSTSYTSQVITVNALPSITTGSIVNNSYLVDELNSSSYPTVPSFNFTAPSISNSQGNSYNRTYYLHYGTSTSASSSTSFTPSSSMTVSSLFGSGYLGLYYYISCSWSDGYDSGSFTIPMYYKSSSSASQVSKSLFYSGNGISVTGKSNSISNNTLTNITGTFTDSITYFENDVYLSYKTNTNLSIGAYFSTSSSGTKTKIDSSSISFGNTSNGEHWIKISNLYSNSAIKSNTNYYFFISGTYGGYTTYSNAIELTRVKTILCSGLQASGSYLPSFIHNHSAVYPSGDPTTEISWTQDNTTYCCYDSSGISYSINSYSLSSGFTTNFSETSKCVLSKTAIIHDLDSGTNPLSLAFNKTSDVTFKVSIKNFFGITETVACNLSIKLEMPPIISSLALARQTMLNGDYSTINSSGVLVHEGQKLKFSWGIITDKNQYLTYDIKISRNSTNSLTTEYETMSYIHEVDQSTAQGKLETTYGTQSVGLQTKSNYCYFKLVVSDGLHTVEQTLQTTGTTITHLYLQTVKTNPPTFGQTFGVINNYVNLSVTPIIISTNYGPDDISSTQSMTMTLEASPDINFPSTNIWTSTPVSITTGISAFSTSTTTYPMTLTGNTQSIIYFRIKIKIVPDAPTTSGQTSLSVNKEYISPILIIYADGPTISLRKNFLGINTKTIDSNSLIEITPTKGRHVIYANASGTDRISFDNFIIDGGSW